MAIQLSGRAFQANTINDLFSLTGNIDGDVCLITSEPNFGTFSEKILIFIYDSTYNEYNHWRQYTAAHVSRCIANSTDFNIDNNIFPLAMNNGEIVVNIEKNTIFYKNKSGQKMYEIGGFDSISAFVPRVYYSFDADANLFDNYTNTIQKNSLLICTKGGVINGITFNKDTIYKITETTVTPDYTMLKEHITTSNMVGKMLLLHRDFKDANDNIVYTKNLYTSYDGNILEKYHIEVSQIIDLPDSQKAENGFDRTQIANSSLSIDTINKKFTITHNNDYVIYVKNKKFTITQDYDVVFSDIDGMHFIYFDIDTNGNLVLLESTNIDFASLINDYCYVSNFYWDSSVSKVLIDINEERHGIVMDSATHKYLHNENGTAFGSGILLSPNVNGNGTSDSDIQFSATAGIIRDEDIDLNILNKSLTTNLSILYKTGASDNIIWKEVVSTDGIPLIIGNSLPAINKLNTETNTWELVDLQDNKYSIVYIFAGNQYTESKRLFSILGENQYSNQSEAVADIGNIPNFGVLPFQEFLLVGAIIYQTKTSFTNSVKSKFIAIDSNNSYWNFTKSKQIGFANATTQQVIDLYNALDLKVDKVLGKQLSTEDYTTAEKNKLAGIEDGAKVNVQADWSQTDDTKDDFIKNKPTISTQYTNEMAQDSVGGILTDTNTIDFTYNANNQIKADVKKQNTTSINLTDDENGIKATANFGNTAGKIAEGNDTRLGTKDIDETNIGDNKIQVYNATTGKLEYQTKPIGSTNLSIANKTSTTLDIVSDTGNDATIPEATTTEAGLLNATDKIKLNNTTNTNSGDETTATIKTKLSTASSTTDGYLTSSDWNTFNNKQNQIKTSADSETSMLALTGLSEWDIIRRTDLSTTNDVLFQLQGTDASVLTNWKQLGSVALSGKVNGFNMFVAPNGLSTNSGQDHLVPLDSIASVFTKTLQYPLTINLDGSGSAYDIPFSFMKTNITIKGIGGKGTSSVNGNFTLNANYQKLENLLLSQISLANINSFRIDNCDDKGNNGAFLTTLSNKSLSLSCNIVNQNSNITTTSTSTLINGMSIDGTGIPANSYISIINNTSFKLVDDNGNSVNATKTGTETLNFTLTGFSGYGYINNSNLSSNTSTWNIDLSEGSGTIYLNNVSSARIKFINSSNVINQNIKVICTNCSNIIFDCNNSNVIFTDTINPQINNILTTEAQLTALLLDLNTNTDGYYILQKTISNWANATAYVVGNLVLSNNILYRCNTAHTSNTSIDTTKFTALSYNVNDIIYKQSVQSVITSIQLHRSFIVNAPAVIYNIADGNKYDKKNTGWTLSSGGVTQNIFTATNTANQTLSSGITGGVIPATNTNSVTITPNANDYKNGDNSQNWINLSSFPCYVAGIPIGAKESVCLLPNTTTQWRLADSLKYEVLNLTAHGFTNATHRNKLIVKLQTANTYVLADGSDISKTGNTKILLNVIDADNILVANSGKITTFEQHNLVSDISYTIGNPTNGGIGNFVNTNILTTGYYSVGSMINVIDANTIVFESNKIFYAVNNISTQIQIDSSVKRYVLTDGPKTNDTNKTNNTITGVGTTKLIFNGGTNTVQGKFTGIVETLISENIEKQAIKIPVFTATNPNLLLTENINSNGIGNYILAINKAKTNTDGIFAIPLANYVDAVNNVINSITTGKIGYQLNPVIGYRHNGTALEQYDFIVIGQIYYNGTNFNTIINYAFNGESETTLPLANNGTFTHNIGSKKLIHPRLMGICISANNGYVIDDVINLSQYITSSSNAVNNQEITLKNSSLNTTFTVPNQFYCTSTTNTSFTPLPANWNMFVINKRNW